MMLQQKKMNVLCLGVSLRLFCCQPLNSLARIVDDLQTPFSGLHLPHSWTPSLHGSCMHDFLCETSVLSDLTMCITVAVVAEGLVTLEERICRVCNTSLWILLRKGVRHSVRMVDRPRQALRGVHARHTTRPSGCSVSRAK